MSAYIIVTYDIDDAEAYEAYVPGVLPTLTKHGVEILVADYEAQRLEGEPRQVNVVLKFESEEAAMNWYNDPEYATVKQIRLGSTKNGMAVLAKQFEMPSQ